ERLYKFKTRYEYLIKNHNNVSLLVSYEYKCPKDYDKIFTLNDTLNMFSEDFDYIQNSINLASHNISHLLMVDISIKYEIKHLEIYDCFSEQLPYFDFIQVPHHGSRYNWNNDLLGRVSNNTNFIISSGGKYNHPHSEVTDSIESSHTLFKADQFT